MDYIKIPLYLSGPNATVDRTDSVTIGTAGSYGVHAFEVERGRNWDNLSIKATFYQKPDNGENTTTPSDEAIQISVVETGDGLIPIPNELFETETDEVGSTQPQTWVTFSGYDGENLKMNSLRLMLEISDTGPTYTTAFTPTPDIEEQLINAVKELRDAACECATQAGEYSFEAAKSATAAKASEQNAYNSEVNAASSELAAELSAQAAEASELNAKQSETIVDGLVQKAENLYEEGASKIEAVFEDSKEEVEAIFNEGATKVENIFNQSTAKIQELTDSAKDSSNKAEEYAKQAKDSADAAKTSQDAALASETNAKTSETNASKNASDAATSATNAGQSETNALGYANRASAQATAAAESQRDAASSRDAAATSANSARTYMLDAKDYRDDAQTAAESTAGYATQASGSANAAQTSASKAATSEKNAHSSEVNAASSATLSDRRATEAATSASNAASSAQDAADSLADMEDLVAHMPQINPENELWQTWNAEEGQYEDTGVLARGQGVAKGGQPGQVLVKNSVANYDTTWVDQMEAIDVPVYSLVKQDVAEDGFFATYYLTKNDVQAGEKINIPKDYLVREAELLEVAETDVPYSGAVIGDKYIDFTINTQASDEDEKHIYLPVKDLVDTYIAGNGISIADNAVNVKIDAANANGLAVDASGIKLNLATSAIAGAMSGADKAKLDASSTTEQMNQAISNAIDETLAEITEDPTKLPFVNINGDTMHGSLTTTELFTDFVTIRNAGTDGQTGFQSNRDTNHIRVFDQVENALVPIEVGEPTNSQDASTKKYVDDKITIETTARTEAIEDLNEAKADKTNPTFTGTLSGADATLSGALTGNTATFSGGVTVPLEPGAEGSATSKKYVDDSIAAIDVSEQIEPLAQRVTTAEEEIGTINTNIANITDGTTELPYVTKEEVDINGNLQEVARAYRYTFNNEVGSAHKSSGFGFIDLTPAIVTEVDGSTSFSPLYVGEPEKDIQAATKKYVDDINASLNNSIQEVEEDVTSIQDTVDKMQSGNVTLPYVPTSGGTITGPIKYGSTPQDTSELTNKAYVDAIHTQAVADAKSYTDSEITEQKGYIDTQDTATLNSAKSYADEQKTSALQEAKAYTDDAVSGIASDETIQQIQSDIDDIKDGTIDLPYIKDSGDTVTGSYDFTGATLNIAEPTLNTNPATKSYVDSKIAGIGEGGEVVAYTNGNGIIISAENVISVNVNTTNSNGLGVDINGLKLDLASSTTAGAMSSTDKIKLDAVPTIETVESSISEAINALGIDEVKQDIASLETSIDNIPIVSVSETNGSIKINDVDTTVYTHPVHTEAQEGFYKVAVDTQGHVTATTPITKEDITILGIPAQDTTYTDATTTKSGLMSPTDKIALNTAVEDIVDIKEDYVSNGVNNVAKGNPAVCEDSVEWPLLGLKVFGKSTQVKTNGYQLFDSSSVKYGYRWSSTGLENVESSAEQYWASAPIPVVAGSSYTVTKQNSYRNFYLDESESVLEEIGAYQTTAYPYTFTVPENAKFVVFTGKMNPEDESAVPINPKNVMLNSGSVALPFEPYTGGKPSPSPEYPQEIHSAGDEGEIGVGVTGENILNPDWINNINDNILFSCRDLSPGNYTISFVSTADWWTNNDNNRTWYIKYYDNSNEEIDGASITFSDAAINVRSHGNFTIPQGTDKIQLNVYSGVTKASVTNLMLNIGLAVLPYEPYQSQSLTFQTPNGLPGIPVDSGGNFVDATGQEWICNYRDWARGVDVKRVQISLIDLGSFSKLSNDENRFYCNWSLEHEIVENSKSLCSIAFYSQSASTNYSFTPYNQYVYFRANGLTPEQVNGLFADISTITVITQLKAPIETPIPADELAAYKALHSYDGTTIVTSDDDLAYIEFQYVTPNQTYLPYIKDSGDIVNGDYTFNGKVNVSQPTENTNVANKEYVDQQVSSAREKQEKLDSYSDAVYTIASMEPNKLYNLRAVDLPDITVTTFAPPEDDNYVSVYHMIFQSNSTPVNLTLPDSVIYPEDFVIETKHIYEINIVDNLLSYQSWPMA